MAYKMMNRMTDDDFYTEIARCLGVPHEGKAFPFRRRTRWNNRVAGRGRFPGRGIVRVFGNSGVLVALRSPNVNRSFATKEAALDFILGL